MAKRKSVKEPDPVEETAAGPSWLAVHYEPVSLFSLRSTLSMSKGGKTLFVPTPYAIKMALIDACFRFHEPGEAREGALRLFDAIKSKKVRVRPPADCVVQNTFVKIRQAERAPEKDKSAPDDSPEVDEDLPDIEKKSVRGLYTSTIAYREMVFFSGAMTLAIEVSGTAASLQDELRQAAAHVNYFGKRGSFFQFIGTEDWDALPTGFTIGDSDSPTEIARDTYGVSQFLDDFGPDLVKAKDGFERVSTFNAKPITMGKHRVLVQTLLPYRQVQATRNFTRFERRTSPSPSPNGG